VVNWGDLGSDEAKAEIGHRRIWVVEAADSQFDDARWVVWGRYGSRELAEEAAVEATDFCNKHRHPAKHVKARLYSQDVLEDKAKYDAALEVFNREAKAIADLVSMAAGNW